MTAPMMTLQEWLVFLVCLGILGIGHGLFWWLTRAPSDRRLRHLVLAAFWVRVVVGVALYAISFYQWPVLRSLQVQDGFWSFALDAKLYHSSAVSIVEAWKHGLELTPGVRYEYLALIAAVYRLLGAQPLYAMLLHAWFGALTGWLAYRIGQRFFDQRSALRGAFFVSFWPSSVLWSSQILKDAPSWCLTLTVLWLVALLVGPHPRLERRARWGWGLQATALAVAITLLTRLRIYLGSVLLLVALVTLIPAACACLLNRRVARAVWRCLDAIRPHMGRILQLGGLTALVIGAVVVARDLDTTRLFSPAHPEEGHVRLGLQHQQRGNLTQAEAEFSRAIELRPDSQRAYLLWAEMLSAVNRPREALQVCASWPGPQAADGAMRKLADELEALLSKETRMLSQDAPASPMAVQVTPKPKPASQEARAKLGAAQAPVAPPSPAKKRWTWRKNVRPKVDAGPDLTLRRPRRVRLRGKVLDDGRPNNSLIHLWTQRPGSPPARILTPTALETDVELPEVASYQFRLVASDGELSELDEVFVTVVPRTPPKAETGPAQTVREPQQAVPEAEMPIPPARVADPIASDIRMEDVVENTPPEVEAGPAQTVRHPRMVVLKGEVRDDGRPTNTLMYWWTQTLGPPARFATPTALETRVQLPEPGRYHFYLTAVDGALTASDEVVVTVEARSLGAIVGRLANQWLAIVSEMRPQWIGSLRNSVVIGGGNTFMDERADISQPLDLLKYLPRAILVGFLAPFPWQWFDTGGSTGAMQIFAGAEMALAYLLLVGLALRALRTIRLFGLIGSARLAIRQARLGGLFILVFGLVLGVAASLVMANLGTLFRIRLLYWLPLLILVAAGDPLGSYGWYRRLVRWIDRWYRRFVRWIDRWRGWPHIDVVGPAKEPAVPTAPESIPVREGSG